MCVCVRYDVRCQGQEAKVLNLALPLWLLAPSEEEILYMCKNFKLLNIIKENS